jgi:MFS family permease
MIDHAVGNRWIALSLLFFARFAMAFQFQSLAAVSPVLMKDLNLEFALLGTLIGVWMMPGAFVAIPGGALAQRFGEKRIVVAGLALMALGTWMTAISAAYDMVLAGRLVSGIGAVAVNVLLTKMAADWFADRELSTAMAVLVVSWPLGIGVALVVLGPLAAFVSWPAAMHATLAICIIALVALAVAYRAPGGPASAGARSSMLQLRELMLASAAGIVWATFNVAYILVVGFVPALLTERGMSAANSAALVSLATWPVVLTAPIGGWIADWSGRPLRLIYFSFIGMALCMALMLAVDPVWLVLLLFGILTGPCAGSIMALPAKALAPPSRALGMGVFFTWYYVGMALFPPLAGLVRDLSGFFAAPLMLGCALLAIGAAALYAFTRAVG